MEVKLESKRFVEEMPELDYYTDEGMQEYVESDEMDAYEQGFMQGYMDAR